MRLSKITQELALALEVASIMQTWGNPSPFQDKINELLVKTGRKPVAPNPSPLARILQKEKLADTVGWWSSTIEHAINALERQERANTRLHLTVFGVGTLAFLAGFGVCYLWLVR